MMVTLTYRLLGVLLLATFFAIPSAPLPPSDTVIIAPGGKVEIAVTMADSLPDSQDSYKAVDLAVAAHGPIHGFSIQVNPYNGECSTPDGTSMGAAIVAHATNVGVVGPYCSVTSMGALPAFETAGLVMVSGTNSNPSLYAAGPRVFNRVMISDPGSDNWIQIVKNTPGYVSWAALFTTTYGHQPADLAVMYFDAAQVLLKAIDDVSVVDGGGNLVISRAALRAAVRSTFRFPGVTGQIDLTAFGDRVNFINETTYNDNFQISLALTRWQWLYPDITHISLTNHPGFLRIVTQAPVQNVLVQPAPGADYEIRTRVIFTPTVNFQFAGLVLWKNELNNLKLGRAFCDRGAPDCSNNALYFDRVEGGVFISPNYNTPVSVLNEIYLRVVRAGSVYTAYYSEDGVTWTLLGSHTPGFVPTHVGVYASNQTTGVTEIPADFDWFVLQQTNFKIFLPLTLK
jgi:hypothetical protein